MTYEADHYYSTKTMGSYGKIHDDDVEDKSFVSWGVRVASICTIVAASFVVAIMVSNNSSSLNYRSNISSVTRLEAIPSDTQFSSLTQDEMHHLFSLFITKYGRTYPKDQYERRFKLFLDNLHDADERNKDENSITDADEDSAVHGITKFSAFSDEELSKMKIKIPRADLKTADIQVFKQPKYTGSATRVDWTDTLTTAVKDQGICGSCWSFSVASQVESDAIRHGLLTTDDTLSAQQILSCEKLDGQCEGGFTENGFQYAKEYGLVRESSFPYRSYDGNAPSCTVDTTQAVVRVSEFYTLDSEESMINYVLSTGPISTCIDSSKWASYVGGVVNSCPADNIDHCVQIVGVDIEEGYWIVRNTWGTNWGENGYIRLALGQDTCGVTTDPIFTTVASATVNNRIPRGKIRSNSS